MPRSTSILAIIAMAAAPVYAGCGARTGLFGLDAGFASDAARVDAGAPLDAAVPPSRCVVPATSTAIVVDGSPGFVFSLTELPSSEPGGGSYVLAAAHGWPPDERLALHVLDDGLVATTRVGEGAHWGAARFDAAAGELVVSVGGGDESLALERYSLGGGGLSRIATVDLCARGCDPAWSGPALGPDARAVVSGDPSGRATIAYILPRVGGAPPVTVEGIDLRLAEAVGFADELVVVGRREDGLAVAHVTWGGVVTRPARSIGVPLVSTRFGTARYRDRDVLVAAAVTGRGLVLLQLRDDVVVGDVTVDPEVAVPSGASISVRGDLAAVAWGEQWGDGRVGAHLAVVDLRDGSLFMPPVVVSAETGRGSASYTIWVAVAGHAEGFAVAWGAWEPTTFYGVYGKVVRCPG